jgi:DNA-binding SARP family transcriptional activator/pimeloyl-ACP methyl ester carboxylesterase
MTRLSLSLLGGLEARLESGSPLAFRTQKAQALLAYLALPPGQAHRRDKLAALLWGEMRDEQARTSLRQALYDIRKTLGDASALALHADGETVALEPAAVDLDVAMFTRLTAEGTPEALEQAATLYRGDLLEGLTVSEEAFEAWLVEERERLRDLAMEALAKLLAHQSRTGAVTAALRTARRLLSLDPLVEPVHRTLMRLQAQLGQRAAALRQYQHCVAVLQRNLGVEPEAETKQLYQEILRARASTSGLPVAIRAAVPPGRPAANPQPAETPLVGRDALVTQLRGALDEAWAGRGRLLAIRAEAGIGKTRLVEEVMAHAAHRSGQVLVGRAYESDRILLFGPFVDAFRAGQLAKDRALIEALGPVWSAELARLLPESAALDVRPRPDQGDYRRLFDCMAELITHLAARDPLLVVLEDLHWADELSLRFLAFLGRRLLTVRVLVVVTAREEELEDAPILRRTLNDLALAGQVTSLTLAPLSRADTVSLVKLLAPTRMTASVDALGEQVWNATEGNPFMVVETMRGLPDGAAAGGVALPQRVREVIGRRLEQVSTESRSLLAVGAVIGREFEFELLRRVAGLDEDATAAAVEELVRRRLLTGVGEHLDFTHDQIREVAYSELPPWRRKRLHHRVAESIEALYAERVPDFWETLADHFERAEAWAKAAGYYLRVAERARRRYAYSIAERSCRQAVDAAAKAPEAGPERIRALELLGDLGSLQGDLDRANQSYQAALDLVIDETGRRRIANKQHRPRLTSRDGARLAFYEHGSGAETLLFMNPIVYGLEIFQPVLENLCQEFRIITMDARGTGGSDPLRAGYGTCDHAADVQAVIEAAGGEPVTAIGISKSSSILVRLAIAAPALVKRLVLISTLLDFWPNTGAPPASEVDARFRAALRAGDLQQAMSLFVATVVTDPATGELADQFTRNLQRLPRESLLNTWEPDPGVDITSVLGQVKAPTLVLHGTEDRRVPLSTAYYLAEHLPDARLHLFERCGHLPIFTATSEFCDVLRRFVTIGEA